VDFRRKITLLTDEGISKDMICIRYPWVDFPRYSDNLLFKKLDSKLLWTGGGSCRNWYRGNEK